VIWRDAGRSLEIAHAPVLQSNAGQWSAWRTCSISGDPANCCAFGHIRIPSPVARLLIDALCAARAYGGVSPVEPLHKSKEAMIGACSEPRIGSSARTSSCKASFKIVTFVQQAASLFDAKI
jgi:hypothetical protein